MSNLIAIDAGLKSAGWAIFPSGGIIPIDAGLIHPRREYRDEDLITRAIDVGQQFGILAKTRAIKEGIIEMPVYYGQGDKNAGSIFKLCVCIGAIASALNENGVTVETVDVPTWKGQLPKEVVIKRIKKILPEYAIGQLNLEKDMWDAVGIGLWKFGYFK